MLGKRGMLDSSAKVDWFNLRSGLNRNRQAHRRTAGLVSGLVILIRRGLFIAMAIRLHLTMMIGRRRGHGAVHRERSEQHRDGDKDRGERAKHYAAPLPARSGLFNFIGSVPAIE
jgi:hypothetical protein